MTWPLSRKRTYFDLTSQFPAEDGNDIQDGITWLFNGIRTIRGLIVGGAGAAVFTRTADSPILLAKNSAENARWLIDHNGLPGGRIELLDEKWLLTQAATATPANPLSSYPLWMTTISGASSQFNGAGTFPADQRYGGRYVDLQPLNVTVGAKSFISTTNKLVDPTKTAISFVLDFDGGVDAVGANGYTTYLGLSATQDPTATTTGFVWLKKASTDTNWQAQCGTGTPGAGTTTTVDTGVAAIAAGSGFQRFRIELHGSTTPYGAVTARFCVDDNPFVSITTNIPTALLYLAFGATITSAGTAHDVTVGRIALAQNLFASSF